MLGVRYLIPGKYSDAYLYMGYLLATNEHRELLVYSLRNIAETNPGRNTSEFPFLDHLLSRNSWLYHKNVLSLFENEDLNKFFVKLMKEISSRTYELDVSKIEPVRIPLDLKGRYILDLHVYNHRVYIGTSDGLYHCQMHFDDISAQPFSGPIKRSDAECSYINTKFSAVHASCGSEGLFTGFREFEAGMIEKKFPELKQTAYTSVRTSNIDGDLINYQTDSRIELRKTIRMRSPIRAMFDEEYENTVTVDVEEGAAAIGDILSVPKTPLFDIDARMQFVVQNGRSLYLYYADGTLVFKKLTYGPKQGLKAKYHGHMNWPKQTVFSIQQLSGGLLLESNLGVYLLEDDRLDVLTEGSSISVRTFPQSIQYRNMAMVINRDGINMVNMFNDLKFSQVPKHSDLRYQTSDSETYLKQLKLIA